MKTLQPTGVLEGETSPYKHKTFTKTAELADTADYSCKGRKGKVVSVADHLQNPDILYNYHTRLFLNYR